MSKEAVKQVIAEFGSQPKASAALGCSQQLMANWIRQGYIPIQHLKGIVKTTKVPIRELIKPEYLEALEVILEQDKMEAFKAMIADHEAENATV